MIRRLGHCGLLGALVGLALLLALGGADAETCLSPFVKRLDRPEKYLYVFCVDADAKDNDFVAVIDVVLLNHPEAIATGAGEATMRPLAAAINNAIFEATGTRIRRAPLTPAHIRAAAV